MRALLLTFCFITSTFATPANMNRGRGDSFASGSKKDCNSCPTLNVVEGTSRNIQELSVERAAICTISIISCPKFENSTIFALMEDGRMEVIASGTMVEKVARCVEGTWTIEKNYNSDDTPAPQMFKELICEEKVEEPLPLPPQPREIDNASEEKKDGCSVVFAPFLIYGGLKKDKKPDIQLGESNQLPPEFVKALQVAANNSSSDEQKNENPIEVKKISPHAFFIPEDIEKEGSNSWTKESV